MPGVEAVLMCDSSSSNPPAKISWWLDGIPVEGFNESSQAGLWGGTVSSLGIRVNVTQDMDGSVYTCQSQNEALKRSVHEAIALRVLCKCKRIAFRNKFVIITSDNCAHRSAEIRSGTIVNCGRRRRGTASGTDGGECQSS